MLNQIQPACTDTPFYTSVLTSVQSEVETIARNLYFRVRTRVSVTLDDLIQEGMIGAWQAATRYDASKVKDSGSFTGYCMKRARGAIIDYIKKHQPAISLEAYLEVETEKGMMQRELVDEPTRPVYSSWSEREPILDALAKLTSTERLAVMSFFQIEDAHGGLMLRENTGVKASSYYNAKARAIKKLARMIQQ
jgi:RNA polymerase sigma factor (sigma-70 family)